jgi:hypothetical protein
MLFAVVVWVAVACQSAPSKLVLFVSGDSRGYLEPCGCRRDQAGGLPGRANLINKTNAADRVVVDVGNMAPGTRDYDRLKLKYMLEGMAAIGYDAVNLGKTEAEFDIETLRSVVKGAALPFVSANIVAKKGGEAVAEAFRIVNRQGARIGIVGVTSCDPQDAGPGVEVRPPIQALADVIPRVRPNCDYLIVLAFADEETLKEIANKFHEVNCVLGGDVPQPSGSALQVNRASVFSVTNKGKVVGRLELVRNGDGYAVQSAAGVKIAADKVEPPKEIKTLLARYKDELRERRYELASAEGMESIEATQSTANEFAGDKACKSCHTGDHKVWEDSAHSHALATLKRVKSEYDPDCLRCHTVGYALSSGFIDEAKTPTLGGVQCENCHGRGKEHVATQQKTALKPVTASTCIKCHDEENSENFHFATFWRKIAH